MIAIALLGIVVLLIIIALAVVVYFISTQRSLVSLDEMFTDHAYNVGICADGTYEANGLIG